MTCGWNTTFDTSVEASPELFTSFRVISKSVMKWTLPAHYWESTSKRGHVIEIRLLSPVLILNPGSSKSSGRTHNAMDTELEMHCSSDILKHGSTVTSRSNVLLQEKYPNCECMVVWFWAKLGTTSKSIQSNIEQKSWTCFCHAPQFDSYNERCEVNVCFFVHLYTTPAFLSSAWNVQYLFETDVPSINYQT